MRFRNWFVFGGSAVIILGLFATDPDSGIFKTGLAAFGSTFAALGMLIIPLVGVAFSHVSRKGLFDWLDMQEFGEKAKESPVGAGLVFVGVCIVISALLGLFSPKAHAQIPQRAYEHLSTVRMAIDQYWPSIPARHYIPGLIEHESCVSLRHSRCWSPTSRLKSAREEGAGLGQITRTWREDGSLRFDALQEMRQRHPALQGLTWENVYQRPDLQIVAILLKQRDNFQSLMQVVDPMTRLVMTDVAYNRGIGGVQSERRACGLRRGCDPQQWWGHVELTCTASTRPLYAGRSACDISRHHPKDVFYNRMPKYVGLV